MSNGKPAINPWFIAVTVTLATFMELLDTSIANVALPYIGGGLGRSYDEVTWILTTYLVANAVILPMSAWLSRVFGRKTYYLACVALFTLTSLFCGLAPSLGIMLSSRVLQGIAGGGLAPVSQAILVDTFPPAKRALASAALEIAIDRGQIDDWFGSPFISWMLAIGVIGWIATVAWEMRLKEPVIDFRLLTSRNFAIASALFFVFGFGLFGSTTLIPQILQSLYGYRATDAGLVLGPGALVITLFAPIAAQLIQRQIVPARILLAISIATLGAAMWYYSTFTLATDYSHYALARAYQGLGYGFFFVPVNVLAYSQLRPDQNNRASSLTNLFRNWGGSFGIAFITTAAERRHQFHQSNLGSALGATSQQLASRVTELTNYLVTRGFSGPDAATAAQAYLYQQFQHQVSLLSFMDCFRVIAWLTLAAVPLLLFVRRFKPAGKAPSAH